MLHLLGYHETILNPLPPPVHSYFRVLNIQPCFEVCAKGPEVEAVAAEKLLHLFAHFCTKMKQLPETKGAPVDVCV